MSLVPDYSNFKLQSPYCKISRFKKEITMITVDKYNIRVVDKGMKYGRDFKLTNESEKPLVEFYDARYPHTEFGQFITRYYVGTILGNDGYSGKGEGGLILDGGNRDEWTVSSRDMDVVRAYLKGYTE